MQRARVAEAGRLPRLSEVALGRVGAAPHHHAVRLPLLHRHRLVAEEANREVDRLGVLDGEQRVRLPAGIVGEVARVESAPVERLSVLSALLERDEDRASQHVDQLDLLVGPHLVRGKVLAQLRRVVLHDWRTRRVAGQLVRLAL